MQLTRLTGKLKKITNLDEPDSNRGSTRIRLTHTTSQHRLIYGPGHLGFSIPGSFAECVYFLRLQCHL